MAQFRGTVHGNRSVASRLGHKSSGLTTECNGWNIGIECYAYYDDEKNRDVIKVYKTRGSSYSSSRDLIATIIEGE